MTHRITENCITCGACIGECPEEAIIEGEGHDIDRIWRSAEFIPVTDRLHLFLRYDRLRFRKDYAKAIVALFCGTL